MNREINLEDADAFIQKYMNQGFSRQFAKDYWQVSYLINSLERIETICKHSDCPKEIEIYNLVRRTREVSRAVNLRWRDEL